MGKEFDYLDSYFILQIGKELVSLYMLYVKLELMKKEWTIGKL